MVYKYFTTKKKSVLFYMMMMKIKGNLCLVQMKKYYWSKKIQILW